MIPLKKSEEDIKEYNEWYQTNQDELLADFDVYFKKEKPDWIKQKHRETIQGFLFKTSYEKCAYCERRPDEGGGFLEIEHFYPKKTDEFRDMAFDFDNLLPSCKQCNTVKGQNYMDEAGNEIINPYCENDMSVHLALNPGNMELSGISKTGEATVFRLNRSLNTNKIIQDQKTARGARYKRIEIQECINKKLKISEKCKQNKEGLFAQLEALLELIDEKKNCTSAYSTIILNHPIFIELVEYIRENYSSKYSILAGLLEKAQQFRLSIKRQDPGY
ncbi:MAG: hypothetical protein GY754_22165 [bacterium]|nr:hypothetical protein [bacterium]